MLEFCETLTLAPATMAAADVAALRRHGFTDREILAIVLAAAYRNFISRIADGLGVEQAPGTEHPAELVRAFGLDPEQAQRTLYADRDEEGAVAPAQSAFPRGRLPAAATDGGPTWVSTTPPAAQAVAFAALCTELAARTAPAPRHHLAAAFALQPEALAATLQFARLVGLGGSGLGRQLEETIGLVVAATLGTAYLGVHHAHSLITEGAPLDRVLGIIRDPTGGSLDGCEREVARFAQKLTQASATMTRSDVDTLRAAGFDDAGILTIVAATAFENFLDRVAAGLGARLEAHAFHPDVLEAFGLQHLAGE